MTAVIHTEKLTKYYGRHRGILEVDLEVEQGEAFGFLGPNGAGKTTMIRLLLDHIRPTAGARSSSASTRSPIRRHPSPARLPPRRVRPLRPADRRPDPDVLRQSARRRRHELPGRADRAPGRRSLSPVQGVLQRQQAEDRPGHRAPAPARTADTGRAHLRPGSAGPAGVLRLIREAKAEGRTVFMSSHILGEVEKTCDRVAIIRDGRLARVARVDALRDIAHHSVELTFVGPPPVADFQAIPGVSEVVSQDHTIRLRVAGSMAPLLKVAARYELADFISREPTLEETFLAEYGDRGAGGDRGPSAGGDGSSDATGGAPGATTPGAHGAGAGDAPGAAEHAE